MRDTAGPDVEGPLCGGPTKWRAHYVEGPLCGGAAMWCGVVWCGGPHHLVVALAVRKSPVLIPSLAQRGTEPIHTRDSNLPMSITSIGRRNTASRVRVDVWRTRACQWARAQAPTPVAPRAEAAPSPDDSRSRRRRRPRVR